MELISRKNLPSFVQQLTHSKPSKPEDLRISLYLPNCRANPKRMATQAQRLLNQCRSLLSKALPFPDVTNRLQRLEKRIHEEVGNPRAEGFAFFLDHEHFESHRLTLKCDPMVVVANSFHILPLLRSLAHEPHYRLVVLKHDCAILARKDHGGLKEELKVAYPHSQETTTRLHQRPSEQNLIDGWNHVDDFTRTLVDLQKDDPRPLAIFGEIRLRKRLIENIQPFMDRPIFCQGCVSDRSLAQLGNIADEAFDLRVADESPADLSEILKIAKEEKRILTDIASISRAASEGLIGTLILGETPPIWGHHDSQGELVLHTDQAEHLNDCVLDDAIEEVIKNGGTVFFAPLRELTPPPTGVATYAVLLKRQAVQKLN